MARPCRDSVQRLVRQHVGAHRRNLDQFATGGAGHVAHRDFFPHPLQAAGLAEIWLAGPDMAYLRDALGDAGQTVYRQSADELAAYAVDNVRPGDVLMVKSSNGTGFGRIVEALTRKFPAAGAAQ